MATDEQVDCFYPLCIQFYKFPTTRILFDEVIEWIRQRIIVLKAIETFRDVEFQSLRERRQKITEEIIKSKLYGFASLINSKGHRIDGPDGDVKNTLTSYDLVTDELSFISLRLALMTKPRLKRLHEELEYDLFIIRINALDEEGILRVMSTNKINYKKLDKKQQNEMKFQLRFSVDQPEDYEKIDFFEVPLNIISPYINLHDIYFHKSKAFVPLLKMTAVIHAHYEEHLEQLFAQISRKRLNKCGKLTFLCGQFGALFGYARKSFQSFQNEVNAHIINIENIDEHSASTFPPCMRIIHEKLRKNHHLKHDDRIYYASFLKDTGLRSDDVVELYKQEFCGEGHKTIEQFKEYEYYVRHVFGENGRKMEYNIKSCDSIIDKSGESADFNGCPFVNFDIEDLGKKMTCDWGIDEFYSEKMKDSMGNCCPGKACSTYFQAVNDGESTGIIDYPNKFFDESIKIRRQIGQSRVSISVRDDEDEDVLEISELRRSNSQFQFSQEQISALNDLVILDKFSGIGCLETCHFLNKYEYKCTNS